MSTTNPFPEWFVPMAATLTQERFTGADWIFERKFDGIRLLAFKNEDVQLFSRTHHQQNIPVVAKSIAKLPHSQLILDGEITWGRGSVTYHVFDVLWIDGRSLMSVPLDERRGVLAELPLMPPLERVTALDHDTPWELAQRRVGRRNRKAT